MIRSDRRLPIAHRPYFRVLTVLVALSLSFTACSRWEQKAQPAEQQGPRPSILLVTLDTTRADAIGPEAAGVQTPSFNSVAARGRRFRQAYASVPETLPSHTSMLTGLYPAGHGLHENARYLGAALPVVAERLRQAGYHTEAFVSSFALARRFGLARGFDVYDDEQPAGRSERNARETTKVAIAGLGASSGRPFFMWVHYYDPHYPYEPPEPFRGQYPGKPYTGEVAFMDEQLGRLLQAFDRQTGGQGAVVIAGDHGEGLGDHGEALHGNLLYQSTMHVPLVIAGPGVAPGVIDAPVSTRRVYHTILDWAQLGASLSLRGSDREVVLGEAMKPFLEYGWQPQVMSVEGTQKAILAGKVEVYDVVSDPGETRNLGSGANLPRTQRAALDDYPVPSPDAAKAPDNLDEEAKRRLASLGYISAGAAPVVRKDAPRPADMVPLFDLLERASGLFVNQQYAQAIPLLEKILAADPYNLDAALRLASAHSALGHDALAIQAFNKAAELAPRSPDVRTYLALHYARGKDWQRAVPLLEPIVAESPDRLPAVEALAVIRERQGRVEDAIRLRQQVYSKRAATPGELSQLGQMAMGVGQTQLAIDSFEQARQKDPGAFKNNLELGVLYLASRRFADARDALDRVPLSHPEYPMALFKRAQAAVLLNEPDAAQRIETARRHATAETRELIARERLFQRQ